MSRSGRIVDLTEQSRLDELLATGPLLIDFWAPWCGPCRTIAPIVDKIAEEYAGRITAVAVNVDEAPEIAERYGVRSIPTLLYLPGPALSGHRVTGIADAARLKSALALPD